MHISFFIYFFFLVLNTFTILHLNLILQKIVMQGHVMFQKGERMANVKFAQYQGTVKKMLGFLAFFTMSLYYY